MFYVSSFDRNTKLYGITDTSDGVTEFYDKQTILTSFKKVKIEGVSGNTIKVVNAVQHVAQASFDKFEDLVRSKVDKWTEETCMDVARKAHFVKKIKGLPIDEMHRVTVENIYPQNVRDAVAQASDYSNELLSVNVMDRAQVVNALRNNVCLVLQQKTNGVITSFLCSGSLAVLDAVYEPGFFESVYLTKNLYGYTYNINKVRPRREGESTKEYNPNMLSVFSCALRFRFEGAHHDGVNKELSSPFYTVNLDKLLGMYILVRPSKLGDRIMPEFYMTARKDKYNFDFQMWQYVKKCLEDGTNYFGKKDLFMKFVDTDTLDHAVVVEDVMQRFNDDFDYIEKVRMRGFSFWES